MALKDREAKLIGIMLIIGGLGAFVALGLPQLDALGKAVQQKGTLEQSNQDLEAQKQTIQTAINTLQEQAKLPNDVKVRQYTDATQQKVVKEILDTVIKSAATRDNTVVYLKPWLEVTPIIPPPPAPDPNAQPPAGANAAPPAPPPPPPLTTVGYEFAIRGTYQTIQSFLESMDQQKEIVEINSVQLLNEGGADRVGGKGAITAAEVLKDPTKPIRLTTKLRLVLERKG